MIVPADHTIAIKYKILYEFYHPGMLIFTFKKTEQNIKNIKIISFYSPHKKYNNKQHQVYNTYNNHKKNYSHKLNSSKILGTK